MKIILTVIMAVMTFLSANAYKYSYTFKETPISQAILRISKDHPEINISFIYKELDNYKTSTRILTDDAYEALRQTIGLNPVSVIKKEGNFYIEALQHGKFCYTGRATGTDDEPVVAATVMLLAPKDSTVITYGITDDAGRFSIPCDRQDVIGKFSCLGYKTTFRHFTTFSVGTIVMPENVVALGEVKVEADNAHLYADKSVYLPTAKQKNASQNAQDLLNRMAIPQLRVGEEIKTTFGQPVDIYIDFVPATDNELSGMLISDVKRVEYYDYPSDPRFQGKAHVINFIMQQYEYGGYVKGVYHDNFVASRQLNGFAKIQYKDMTYDWAGGVYYMNDKHSYEETCETFRLPQSDGTIKSLERESKVQDSKIRSDIYWTSVKALYRTENVSMSNMVTADFDHTPEQYTRGSVSYTPAEYNTSEYSSRSSNRINSLVYSGYWYLALPHGNSVTFNPYYAYTHTDQTSTYDEVGFDAILNGAIDDSHQASGDIAFTHSFGEAGTLKAMCQGRFLLNRTRYSGSSSVSDQAHTYRLGPGVSYRFSTDKLYCTAGMGLHWDKSIYGNITENSTAPWINISLQSALNKKSSISLSFNYSKSIPASSYRSASLIKADPLISYTGNPSLVPYNSFQIEGNYSFIPSNKYSLSVFGFAWIVGNRYVFDYEASSTGILRTIKQPMGKYAQWQYGVQASTRQFDNNLYIGTAIYIDQAHNGTPYNWTKSKLVASISAYYYLDQVYFGATYATPSGYPDGCMIGKWMEPRSSYTFQVGWNNRHWNLRFYTRNFLRYGTYVTKGITQSKYYDITNYIYNSSYSGFFRISATYTFSFGKKVKVADEAYQASGASSGILK